MKRNTVILIALMTLVGCSTAQRQVSAPALDRSDLRARLGDLDDRGAREVMPADFHDAVDEAITAAVDGASLAGARRSLEVFEAGFDEIAVLEVSAAREACLGLQHQMTRFEESAAARAGCDGLAEAFADLEARLWAVRELAYSCEGNVRAARRVGRLVREAENAIAGVAVDAAACGALAIGADDADQMLEAADRMAEARLAYGSAVRLYARIVEGAPDTEAAEAARRRIGIFGHESSSGGWLARSGRRRRPARSRPLVVTSRSWTG
jgi:hypothetical protein